MTTLQEALITAALNASARGLISGSTNWAAFVAESISTALAQQEADKPFQPDWVNYRQGYENGKAEALAQQGEPVAWLKEWVSVGYEGKETPLSRIDATPECERWLERLNPRITPLVKAAPQAQRLTELKLLMVITAYEQGVGKGIQRRDCNPYATETDEHAAWALGYSEGLDKQAPQPAQDGHYPINGSVWFRKSTGEWVLELSGSINGTSFVSRHTQPAETLPEDVPSLSTIYTPVAQPVAQPLTIEAIKSMDYRGTLDEHIRVVRMTESAHGIGAPQDHIPDAGKMGKPIRELTDEDVEATAIAAAAIVWPDTDYVGWTDDDKVFFREFTRTVLKKARE